MSDHSRAVARQFRVGTPGLISSDVLAMFSQTLEVQVLVNEMPEALYGISSKAQVTDVLRPMGREGVFSATLVQSGAKVTFHGKEGYTKIGGGAANAIGVLRQLERDWPKPHRLGLVAGIGSGEKAGMMMSKLRPTAPFENDPPWLLNQAAPIELGLLPARGTNITLSVRIKHGPQILLWQQEPYDDGASPVPALRHTSPKLALFMSVKPNEIEWVEELVPLFARKKKPFLVFSPSSSLLVDRVLNARARAVAKQSHLSAMSHREAMAYLGDDSPFGVSSPFDLKRADHRVLLARAVASIAAPISIVTFEEHGVIASCSGEANPIIEPAWRCGAVRDVVGCGDAFLTAASASYVLGNGPKRHDKIRIDSLTNALKHGVIVAGLNAAHNGPSGGISRWDEVYQLDKKNTKKDSPEE